MAAGAAPHRKLDHAERAERAAIVFDLKLQGLTYRAIDVLTQAPDGPTGGHRISATRAKELVYEEYERRVDPRVDTWRQIQLDRLEGVLRDHLALRNAHWDRAMGDEEKAPEVTAALAVDRALNGITKTVEAEGKLLGVAVTKIEAEITEVTQQDIVLREMVSEIKAKNARIEAELRNGREHPA